MKQMDDSAQLILIAGFAIGLGIVVSTIMLNNVIYASNMASESSVNTNLFDFSNVVQMTSGAFSGAYNNATRDQSSFNETFDNYMTNYTGKVSNMYALYGTSFSLKTGTFYDAYFTENGLAGGNPDWVVMDDINETSSFLITPNTSSLGNEANAFEVQAVNQSDVSIWSIKLYNNGGNIGFNVTHLTGYVNDTAVHSLNITNNSIDNGDYFKFYFNTDTADETYQLKFLNGTRAVGVFSISGNLTNGQPFTRIRYKMTNTTVTISSVDTRINVSVPICIP